MGLPALSLWQPWCAVICGSDAQPTGLGKRLENRTSWKTCNCRGPLLIHASQGFGGLDAFGSAMETIVRVISSQRASVVTSEITRGVGILESGLWKPAPELVRGALVGRCRLVGVITNETEFQRFVEDFSLRGTRQSREAQRAWWYGGFALVLEDVERLVKPIPYKGHQKLFRVPEKVLDGATWVPVQ